MTIRLEDLTVNFDERFQLNNINWQIEDNQHWVITGANGSGKSALAAVLAGAGNRVGGQLSGVPARVLILLPLAASMLVDNAVIIAKYFALKVEQKN